MKVYVYMGDPWACGHYRMMWPGLAAAQEPGVEVEVVEPNVRRVSMMMDPNSGQVLTEAFPPDADVVVFQRPSLVYLQQVIRMLQARGVAVVIDMDDDLTKIDPRNPAHKGYRPTVWHPKAKRFIPNPHNANNATQACRMANLVTVTTTALAQRYGPGHSRVIPNYVPQAYLALPHRDSEVVGWGGVAHSHPDDLQAVGASLARLTRGEGVRFVTVGDKAGVARALGLAKDPGGPGSVDFKDWAPSLAHHIGIGIAPLARTRFNEAKSRLKPLEYAACGVPAVASPLPDYAAFAAEGGCVLADKPREWERTLRGLVTDEARRQDQAHRARAVAAANTYEGNGWRWAEAWADAVKALRGATAAAV